ncbi:MAG: 3-phosphoshikimate 1-carboxyvinyltransferase [Pyrinomonadaceae bacterium]
MIIQPAKKLHGKLSLPGDKSISHRAAMFAALATGETQIENFASSADCAATLNCLENLGVEITRAGSSVKIKGVGKIGFEPPTVALDCENSGTTVRLLSGILAGQNFTSELNGDESLKKRPMRRVIEPLEKMGAKIESASFFLPMIINGKHPLKPVEYVLPVASAQVKSCILLAGLFATGKTTISFKQSAVRNLKPEIGMMRDHTERMLNWFGVKLKETLVADEDGFFIHQTSIEGTTAKLVANGSLNIPSDISSAAFFLVAAACLSDSQLTLENVGLNPTRTAILDVLENCGVKIEKSDEREVCNEPVGNLTVYGSIKPAPTTVKAVILQGGQIPGLIDELPVLAVLGTQLEGGLTIRDASELRVKESDRIAATVENLQRMGAIVEEFPDGLRVEKSTLRGAQIETYGDHRIAMAFAVAGLFAVGNTKIMDADCVKVSFPEFFDSLKKVCE